MRPRTFGAPTSLTLIALRRRLVCGIETPPRMPRLIGKPSLDLLGEIPNLKPRPSGKVSHHKRMLFPLHLQPELDQAAHGLGTRGLILLFGHPCVECRKRRGLHSDDYLNAFACRRRPAFFLC